MKNAVIESAARNFPLPPMDTAQIYQAVWQTECRQAETLIFGLLSKSDKDDRARTIADVMIDRGLAALSEAPTNKVRLYASIGILRFAEFRRLRFLALKEAILSAFMGNPPDSVRQRIENIEAVMWQQRN